MSGCQYFLDLKDSGRRGVIRYKYGLVGDWDTDHFDGRSVFTSEMGLKPTDGVLWLDGFYPNGYDKTQKRYKENFRQGVGTEALKLVVSDAVKLGMKAIRICTSGKPMETFLQKNGFKPLRDNKGTFYLLLPEPKQE